MTTSDPKASLREQTRTEGATLGEKVFGTAPRELTVFDLIREIQTKEAKDNPFAALLLKLFGGGEGQGAAPAASAPPSPGASPGTLPNPFIPFLQKLLQGLTR